MSYVLGGIVGLLVGFASFALMVGFVGDERQRPLSERVKAACGSQAMPIDFSAGGELGGLPVKDVVLVTCESRKPNEDGQYRTFKEVVQR